MMVLLTLALTLGGAPPRPASRATDEAALAALKTQARAAATSTGCKDVAACKALPLGSRPCGGPSEFVVYCASSTNEAKLNQKVKRATEAEAAFNGKHGVMSICSVLAPPAVKLEKGACVAVEPKAFDQPM